MKICSKKDIKVVTGVMAASLLFSGCAITKQKDKPLKNDPSIKTEIDLNKISDLGNIVYKRSIKYFMMFISASVFVGAFSPFIPSGNRRFGLEVKKKKNQKLR